MTRRVRVYAGPSCPANPEHGPLLEISGYPDLYCPHHEHHRDGTRSFFTFRELTTPGVPPQTPAAALQRGIPVSGGTPAAAAGIQPHGGLRRPSRPPGLSPQAGDRGAEPLDELTLRALWGDR